MKSDSSISSRESEDSDSDCKGRIKVVGNIFPSGHEAGVALTLKPMGPIGISKLQAPKILVPKTLNEPIIMSLAGDRDNPSVTLKKEVGAISATPMSDRQPFIVYGVATLMNTPTESISATSERKTIIQATLKESIQRKSPTSICFVRDFLVNPSRWRERGSDSKIPVDRYSSRFPELRGLKNLRCYSSKTLEVYFQTTEDKPSIPFFGSWGVSDIGWSGKYLTANILAFHRIGKECSLLDILEPKVSPRYFLSPKTLKWLLRKAREDPHFKLKLAQQSMQTTIRESIDTDRDLLSSTPSTKELELER